MDTEKYYLLNGKLADTLLNYLGKHPFIEVASMIDGLYNMKPVKIEPLNQQVEQTSSLQSDICQTK